MDTDFHIHQELPSAPGPIGIFDSGFGGLTVMRRIRSLLPQYDYLYLGDNARAPYGVLPFDTVYRYTLQGVHALFSEGCHLVIIACNTASAKALRTIQQNDLPRLDPERRVLGVIRPTAEIVGHLSHTHHIGLLATEGTVKSHSYDIEISKATPEVKVTSVACPEWASLVESGEYALPCSDKYIQARVEELMATDPLIDLILLGCTHYPFLMPKIKRYAPPGMLIMDQGEYVARSLKDYLSRHTSLESHCTKGASCHYFTTDNPSTFDRGAHPFLGENVHSEHIKLFP